MYLSDIKSFCVRFHKHSQRSSNIFKKATFVRELRILSVYLVESKQDHPNFELTYFTNVCFLIASIYLDKKNRSLRIL